MSEENIALDVLWPDSELKKITIDYDHFTFFVKETTGVEKEIDCIGYIAFQTLSFWDEMVIENAQLFTKHPFLDSALGALKQRMGERIGDSGSPTRNAEIWKVLSLCLSDGTEILVVAGEFRVRKASK